MRYGLPTSALYPRTEFRCWRPERTDRKLPAPTLHRWLTDRRKPCRRNSPFEISSLGEPNPFLHAGQWFQQKAVAPVGDRPDSNSAPFFGDTWPCHRRGTGRAAFEDKNVGHLGLVSKPRPIRPVHERVRQLGIGRAGRDAELPRLLASLVDQKVVGAKIEDGFFRGVQARLQNQQSDQRLALSSMQLDDNVARGLVMRELVLDTAFPEP